MKSLVARVWWFLKSRLAPRHAGVSPVESEAMAASRKLFLERRFELRKTAARSCQLGLMQPGDHDEAMFEEQTGVLVNESRSGMLLMLGSSPPEGKLIEVHTGGTSLRPFFSLVEVRWSKPIRNTSEGDLYLVGCRMSFGPSSYWAI
jgi:hypothetical protein